jgi:hypothetical protein
MYDLAETWRAVSQQSAAWAARHLSSAYDADADAVLLYALLFLLSFLVAVLGRVTANEEASLIGGYGTLFFGVGGAPFQLNPDLNRYPRLTGSILVGFSVLLVVGGLMGDVSGLWHPTVAALLILGAAAVVHVLGLRKIEWAGLEAIERPAWLTPTGDSIEVPETARARFIRAGRSGWVSLVPTLQAGLAQVLRARLRYTRWTQISVLATLVGTVLWLLPTLWTRDPNPNIWGMLKTIGPLWYLGLACVLIAFAVGRRDELSAGLATFSFGLATTLAPALVYGAPREPTAEKQMRLTRYLLIHHHIHVSGGIYQAFSAMFSGMAWFSELLGIHGMLGPMSLLGIATFWPALLVLMRVTVLRSLTGRLLTTTTRRWTAVLLVLLVDTLDNDYFSPQSIGYVLAIGTFAIAINGRNERPFGKRVTVVLLTLVGAALAPTHELSPYMAAGALVILSIFGEAPFWTCLPVGIPALLWAGVVHKAIGGNLNFTQLFDLANFRPPVTVSSPGLFRDAVVGVQSHTLLLALLMLMTLGAIGFFANVRRKWAWAYALCPIVGVGFILINPYGNEGIFRATLFAIPWMAILAMNMPAPARLAHVFVNSRVMRRVARPKLVQALARPKLVGVIAHPRTLTVGISTCLIAFGATFVVAAYAMDGTMVLRRDDVSVVDYLTQLPAQNAFVLSVGSADNPAEDLNGGTSGSGSDFTVNYKTVDWVDVADTKQLKTLTPTAADLQTLRTNYRDAISSAAYGGAPTSPLYVIWTYSSLLYSQEYGLQSPSQMYKWLGLLQTSRSWKLVDNVGGAYLFKERQ